jgi:hypothetical protein
VGPRAFWWRLAAGGSLLALVGAVVVGVVLSSSGGSSAPNGAASRTATGATTVAADPDPPPAAPTRAKSDPPVTISVADRAVGQPIASGFLGFSLEFQAVRAYTGSDPAHINPVLVQLIRNLTPAQAPVLRIGGDSTDVSYAPAPGVKPPGYVGYRLTPSWPRSSARA